MKESVLDVLMYLFEHYLDEEADVRTPRVGEREHDDLALEVGEGDVRAVLVDEREVDGGLRRDADALPIVRLGEIREAAGTEHEGEDQHGTEAVRSAPTKGAHNGS